MIPSVGTKVEYVNLPLDDSSIFLPLIETSAISMLSVPMPVIIPL